MDDLEIAVWCMGVSAFVLLVAAVLVILKVEFPKETEGEA